MVRITFVIFALGCFVQLVNGQDACEAAGAAITDRCNFMLSFANPALCTGSCEVQVATAVATCANSVSNQL